MAVVIDTDRWVPVGDGRHVCVDCRSVFGRGRRCTCDAETEAETAATDETTAAELAQGLCRKTARPLLSRAGIMAALADLAIKARRAKSTGLERINTERQILRQLGEMIAGDDLPAKLDRAEAAVRRLKEQQEQRRGAAGVDDLAST